MSKLAGVIEVLENYEFEDFRGEGAKKWDEEVKTRTRPFLEAICQEVKRSLDVECKYRDKPGDVKKAIDSFDWLALKFEVGGEEVKPVVRIGFYHLEPSKAIYTGLLFWGSKEKMERVKEILDGILEIRGDLFKPKTFGGMHLIYQYRTLSIDDIKGREDEEVVKEIVSQLTKIISDIKNNQKFEEVKDILKEERMIFRSTEVEALVSAINTKPFIILAGISGTGKTQLARLVAQKWIEKGNVSSAKDLFGKPDGDYYSIPETELQPSTPETELQSGDRKRYAFMPVRPDWNEAQKVFGFYNPLTGLFYPSDALRVILSAYREYVEAGKEGHPPKKHFIILDEMNLARVEYYFSDILSAMENTCKVRDGKLYLGEPFPIHFLSRCVLSRPDSERTGQEELLCPSSEEKCDECIYRPLCEGKEGEEISELTNDPPAGDPIPPRIAVPPNLVVIGTVNIDETTFSFSPKVLDRAFVLEFTEVEPEKVLKEGPVRDFVSDLIKILKPVNLHFGYRVMREMEKFFSPGEGNKDEKKEDKKEDKKKKEEDEKLDFLLKSKVLTKIHGGREKVERILWQLWVYCKEKKEEDVTKEDLLKLEGLKEKILGKDGKKDISAIEIDKSWRYPHSARKIKQMLMMLEERGYVSYFE